MERVTQPGFYNGKFRKAGQSTGAPAEGRGTDLNKMTKAELIAEAEARKASVTESMTKADIIAVLQA